MEAHVHETQKMVQAKWATPVKCKFRSIVNKHDADIQSKGKAMDGRKSSNGGIRNAVCGNYVGEAHLALMV